MTKMETMVRLAGSFRVNYDDDTLQFMLSALDDVSDEELEAVAKKIMQRCRTMPSIAEIRDFVEVYVEEHPRPITNRRPKKTREERNAEAWKEDQAETGMNDEEYRAWVKETEEKWGEPYYPAGYLHENDEL